MTQPDKDVNIIPPEGANVMREYEYEDKWKEAQNLIGRRRFGEALTLIDELDAAKPAQRDVARARVDALTGLRRFDEARAECDRMINELGDARGEQLKNKIAAAEGQPVMVGKKKSSGLGRFLVLLIVAAIVAAGIYYYMNYM